MEGCFLLTILLLTLCKHTLGITGSSFCQKTSSSLCRHEYFNYGKNFFELECPIKGSGEAHWYFMNSKDVNFTTFPFPFCNCDFCDLPPCEVTVKGNLRFHQPLTENNGIYECRREDRTYCYELEGYKCTERPEPLVYDVPPSVPAGLDTSVSIQCQAEFGCDKSIMGQIWWEYKGEIITSNYSENMFTCSSKNATNIQTELIINKVKEDEFHYPFVCIVTDHQGDVVKRFNVSLINKDPQVQILITDALIIGICVVIVIILSLITGILLWNTTRYLLLRECSILSRFCCGAKDYEFCVFILHDHDDSSMANKIKMYLKDLGYRVFSVEDIPPGADTTKEVKERLHVCASVITLYPNDFIPIEFEHQLTAVKETIKPYMISVLVHQERTHYKKDERFRKLNLKHYKHSSFCSVFGKIQWRMPVVPRKGNYLQV